MWLSILILAPFEFDDFGSRTFLDESGGKVERTISDRVLRVVQECLRYDIQIAYHSLMICSDIQVLFNRRRRCWFRN